MKKVKNTPKHVENWIIGVDEVGRGPLAGPVTVAAVMANIIPDVGHGKLNGIRDSKKLSHKQRVEWNTVIKKNFFYSIHSVPPRIIDKRGISYAIRLAVSKCLTKILSTLQHKPVSALQLEVLLDGGLEAPLEYEHQRTIIKGDERVPIIAAASIIAKVHRDRYMIRLAKKFPQYDFYTHKGYGTHMHREAIKKHGLSEHHRVSFCKKIKEGPRTDPLTD